MKVFLDQAGRKYLAEAATHPSDSHLPSPSPHLVALLEATGVPMHPEEIAEAFHKFECYSAEVAAGRIAPSNGD